MSSHTATLTLLIFFALLTLVIWFGTNQPADNPAMPKDSVVQIPIPGLGLGLGRPNSQKGSYSCKFLSSMSLPERLNFVSICHEMGFDRLALYFLENMEPAGAGPYFNFYNYLHFNAYFQDNQFERALSYIENPLVTPHMKLRLYKILKLKNKLRIELESELITHNRVGRHYPFFLSLDIKKWKLETLVEKLHQKNTAFGYSSCFLSTLLPSSALLLRIEHPPLSLQFLWQDPGRAPTLQLPEKSHSFFKFCLSLGPLHPVHQRFYARKVWNRIKHIDKSKLSFHQEHMLLRTCFLLISILKTDHKLTEKIIHFLINWVKNIPLLRKNITTLVNLKKQLIPQQSQKRDNDDDNSAMAPEKVFYQKREWAALSSVYKDNFHKYSLKFQKKVVIFLLLLATFQDEKTDFNWVYGTEAVKIMASEEDFYYLVVRGLLHEISGDSEKARSCYNKAYRLRAHDFLASKLKIVPFSGFENELINRFKTSGGETGHSHNQ